MSQTMVGGSPSSNASRESMLGLAYALGAFLLWGVAPIYFKAVGAANPVEILAHRVVWTAIMMIGLIYGLGKTDAVMDVLRQPRRLPIYALSTVLISINWLTYIYAISIDHLVDASLGYYINPLVNVLLGMMFLSEKLNRWQGLAVALAGIGVGYQLVAYGEVPWISLTLAFSFGFYALVRKKAKVDPLAGLLVETLLLTPVGLIYLFWLGSQDAGQFVAGGWWMSVLLIASGIVTGLPLILFMFGAQRLTLSTIGLMQYIAPTIQLVLAVAIFGEPFSPATMVTFAFIWLGLVIYSWDAFGTYRRARRTA
ncbi:EamA family transporter RarD [Inquilinus sp. CAU 1745]|uniref:EamA family transporter RarD n=1 Tax=Inquilinus sp. CAU 1745 TaxID=3140369 RepID=UPI00325B7062